MVHRLGILENLMVPVFCDTRPARLDKDLPKEVVAGFFQSLARAMPKTGFLVKLIMPDEVFEESQLDLHPRLAGYRLNYMQPVLKDPDFADFPHIIPPFSNMYTFERTNKKKFLKNIFLS